MNQLGLQVVQLRMISLLHRDKADRASIASVSLDEWWWSAGKKTLAFGWMVTCILMDGDMYSDGFLLGQGFAFYMVR